MHVSPHRQQPCGLQACARSLLAYLTRPNFTFPTQSVASTRWMLQDEMRLQNTECDNCIIGTMFAAQYLACLCWVSLGTRAAHLLGERGAIGCRMRGSCQA